MDGGLVPLPFAKRLSDGADDEDNDDDGIGGEAASEEDATPPLNNSVFTKAGINVDVGVVVNLEDIGKGDVEDVIGEGWRPPTSTIDGRFGAIPEMNPPEGGIPAGYKPPEFRAEIVEESGGEEEEEEEAESASATDDH